MNGIPEFRGTRELKFTREEMDAIRNAERELGYEPRQERGLPDALGSLLGALLLVVVLGIVGDLVVVIVPHLPAPGTERPTPPAAVEDHNATPGRPISPVPEYPTATSADGNNAQSSNPSPAPNPLPAGVVILRKLEPDPDTRRVQVLLPLREAESTQQTTAAIELSPPAELQPVTQADQALTHITNIAARGSSPPLVWPRLTMPIPEQVRAAGIGTWHRFSSSPAISEGVEQVRQRPFPVFRQPAPRISAFNRYVIGAVIPRLEFAPIPPPMPGTIPLWGDPVCRCRQGTERR